MNIRIMLFAIPPENNKEATTEDGYRRFIVDRYQPEQDASVHTVSEKPIGGLEWLALTSGARKGSVVTTSFSRFSELYLYRLSDDRLLGIGVTFSDMHDGQWGRWISEATEIFDEILASVRVCEMQSCID